MQNRYDSRQQRFKDWLRSSRNKKDAPRKRKHKLSGCNDAEKKATERIYYLLSVLIFFYYLNTAAQLLLSAQTGAFIVSSDTFSGEALKGALCTNEIVPFF